MKNKIATLLIALFIVGCTANAALNKALESTSKSVVVAGCIAGNSRANAADKAKVATGLKLTIDLLDKGGVGNLEANIKTIDPTVAPFAADIANWVIYIKSQVPAGATDSEIYNAVDQDLTACYSIFGGTV